MPLWFLWLLVPLAPALCVHGVDWAFWTLTGRAERFLPLSHTLMLRAILVSVPFLVLAMVATYARKAATPGWTAAVGRAARLGIALNLLLWTVYLPSARAPTAPAAVPWWWRSGSSRCCRRCGSATRCGASSRVRGRRADMTGIADAARSELRERLAHFKTTPHPVLDLSGGVTDAAADTLRRILPAARVIATRGPVDVGIAAAPAAGVVRRALGALRRLLAGAAPHVTHLTATPDRLPLDDGSIDLVLGHWLAPGAAALDPVLAESRRVLAPGGLFLWTTPGRGGSAEPLDMHDLGSALTRA
ncbi:MAG: class I SAM-dependent methyltransferase, partial [Gammaproteobacteria bacterium]